MFPHISDPCLKQGGPEKNRYACVVPPRFFLGIMHKWLHPALSVHYAPFVLKTLGSEHVQFDSLVVRGILLCAIKNGIQEVVGWAISSSSTKNLKGLQVLTCKPFGVWIYEQKRREHRQRRCSLGSSYSDCLGCVSPFKSRYSLSMSDTLPKRPETAVIKAEIA